MLFVPQQTSLYSPFLKFRFRFAILLFVAAPQMLGAQEPLDTTRWEVSCPPSISTDCESAARGLMHVRRISEKDRRDKNDDGLRYRPCVEVYSIEGQRKAQLIPDVEERIGCVCVSGDGRFVACGCVSKFIVWDLKAKQIALSEISPKKTYGEYRMAFIPNGTQLAVNNRATGVAVYDVAIKEKNEIFGPEVGYVDSIDISGDAKLIAVGKRGRRVIVADIATRKIVIEDKDTTTLRGTGCVKFSPDGSSLGAIAESEFRIYDLESAKVVQLRQTRDGEQGNLFYNTFAWHPDKKSVGMFAMGEGLRLFPIDSRLPSVMLDEEMGFDGLTLIAFSPDGKFVVTDGYEKRTRKCELLGSRSN